MMIKGDTKMKKLTALIITLVVGIAVFSGCSTQPENPGTPPPEVINPSSSSAQQPSDNSTNDNVQDQNSETANVGDILENAVSVRIGRDGQKDWQVNMYNNAASLTMLDYLSGSALLFPAYTYEEEQGFVAQNIRGTYSRDDETTVADVKAGELYLFSGGQLRLYFKDMEGANITATPVGYYAETEGLTEAVQEAYQSNLGDTWGVDVYFWITKTL